MRVGICLCCFFVSFSLFLFHFLASRHEGLERTAMKMGTIDPNFAEAVLHAAPNKPLETGQHWIYFSTCLCRVHIDGLCWKHKCVSSTETSWELPLRVSHSLSLIRTKHMKRITRSILIAVYLPLQPGAPRYLEEAHRGQGAWGYCGAVTGQCTFAVLHNPLPLPPAATLASSGDSILL